MPLNWNFPAKTGPGNREQVNQRSRPPAQGREQRGGAVALAEGVHSADVILNILGRQRDPLAPITILTPERSNCGTSLWLIAPAMTPYGWLADGTHRDLDLRSELKLFGTKAAIDEVMANGDLKGRRGGEQRRRHPPAPYARHRTGDRNGDRDVRSGHGELPARSRLRR